MRSLFSASSALALCTLANAATINMQPFRPRQTSSSSGGASFQAIDHTGSRYTTNITLNGVVVTIMIDTGSTDLWVMPPGGMGTLNETEIKAQIGYGDGTDIVSGNVAVAPLDFGGYSVPQQAFLNVLNATKGEDADFAEGIYGLIGLSFDSPGASQVNDAVTKVSGEDATWGQSVLANIFDQHPDKQNFIGISLSRTDDLEGTADGVLNIGEYGDEFAAAAEAAAEIPLYRNEASGSVNRWSVLMDGLYVDGESIPLTSSIAGAPAGKNIVVFDTGAPRVAIPQALINAIYSKVPGAVLAVNLTLSPELVLPYLWIIPCLTVTVVEAVFGGLSYPIHPLDLSEMTAVPAPDGKNYTTCVSVPFGSNEGLGVGEFDGLWGVPFLRNTYTVFDFGDSTSTRDPTGTAFVKLISQTNATKAAANIESVRSNTMSTQGLPEEIGPVDLLAIFQQAGLAAETDADDQSGDDQSSTAGQTSTDVAASDTAAPTAVTSTLAPITIQTSAVATASSDPETVVGNLNSFAADDTTSDSPNATLNKWGPIIVGLLGANALIGLILLVLGVITCVRKGSSSRSQPYAPVRFKDSDLGSQPPRGSTSYEDKPYAP